MFGKLKDLNEMRKQAAQVQAALAEEKIEVEKQGVKLIMNGNMEVLEIAVAPEAEMDKNELAQTIKGLFNEALKKVQRLMTTKMMGRL
jgi:DNA-binding protein YbaB